MTVWIGASIFLGGLALGFILGWSSEILMIHQKCREKHMASPCGFNQEAVK